MTIDNQLAHNKQPRVTGTILALLATTALYACTPTGERPELTDQTVPTTVTTEADPLSEYYTKELSDYMLNDERTLSLNSWVRYFSEKLNVAAIENPSIVSLMSSADSEGNASFGYSIERLNKVYTFSITGKEDIDNKLGLIPDSIAVDISSKNGDESDGNENGFEAYITFNPSTQSYDTGYTDITVDLNGSKITSNFSASIGGVTVANRQKGDFGGYGTTSLSALEASNTDAESIRTILEYLDKAIGGSEEPIGHSPNTGEENENSGQDSGPSGQEVITYGTVPSPTIINGEAVVNTVPASTIKND